MAMQYSTTPVQIKVHHIYLFYFFNINIWFINYLINCNIGFHIQPCVNPMYNHLVNTELQDFSNERNSPIRVCNENNISLINNKWKVLDYRKVIMKSTQPLAIYYKLGALLTNCLTCLDGNQIGEYFNCVPPTLEQYLI
jgi:hypothetical protein